MKKNANKIIIITLGLILVSVSVLYFFSLTENADAQDDNPIGQITQPKKTTTTTVTTQLTLPQPLDSPIDPYADVPIVQIGEISIPKINMTQNVYEGVELTVLNVGPGHWPGTAQPGGYGNTVIAGHRVTHSKPFRNVDQLEPGDDIIVSTDTGTFNYKVTGTEIVYPKDIWIVDQTPGYRLTLFACHPPGSASQRIVIYADLVDPPTVVTQTNV